MNTLIYHHLTASQLYSALLPMTSSLPLFVGDTDLYASASFHCCHHHYHAFYFETTHRQTTVGAFATALGEGMGRVFTSPRGDEIVMATNAAMWAGVYRNPNPGQIVIGVKSLSWCVRIYTAPHPSKLQPTQNELHP
jgi:hypothetical protein